MHPPPPAPHSLLAIAPASRAAVIMASMAGVVTPSARHVAQTEARWRSYGLDPVVVPLSPYDSGHAPVSAPAIADALGAGSVGLVVLDCMGFRRETRVELEERLGVPVLAANLLVARLVAELVGA